MLLERPGEVITRQEIQTTLWPNDTVVEFETSINAAIRRLREPGARVRAVGNAAEESPAFGDIVTFGPDIPLVDTNSAFLIKNRWEGSARRRPAC